MWFYECRFVNKIAVHIFLVMALDPTMNMRLDRIVFYSTQIEVFVIFGHHTVDMSVNISHRAVSFICRFWKPPSAGEVLPNFSWLYMLEDGGP
jgi:hypothetical protein